MCPNVSARLDNSALAVKVASGDELARKEMIEANIPLVHKIVNDYVGKSAKRKRWREDMVSDGYLALTDAVNKIASGATGENPTAYLATCIRHAVMATEDNNAGVGACSKTIREHGKRGTPLPKHVSLPENYGDIVAAPDGYAKAEETWETILACTESDDERQMLVMLKEEQEVADIAKALKKSVSWVYDHRAQIYERFSNSEAK